MIIEWTISKKRGNHRPMLHYAIRLEEFERDLAVPPVRIESSVPKPENGWETHCHPGQNERKGPAVSLDSGTYLLSTPSHKQGEHVDSLRLPWRESGEYPEVEASFRVLRERFERVLKEAYDSRPMQSSGSLEMTSDLRRHVASGVIAQRFLQAVGI